MAMYSKMPLSYFRTPKVDELQPALDGNKPNFNKNAIHTRTEVEVTCDDATENSIFARRPESHVCGNSTRSPPVSPEAAYNMAVLNATERGFAPPLKTEVYAYHSMPLPVTPGTAVSAHEMTHPRTSHVAAASPAHSSKSSSPNRNKLLPPRPVQRPPLRQQQPGAARPSHPPGFQGKSQAEITRHLNKPVPQTPQPPRIVVSPAQQPANAPFATGRRRQPNALDTLKPLPPLPSQTAPAQRQSMDPYARYYHSDAFELDAANGRRMATRYFPASTSSRSTSPKPVLPRGERFSMRLRKVFLCGA